MARHIEQQHTHRLKPQGNGMFKVIPFDQLPPGHEPTPPGRAPTDETSMEILDREEDSASPLLEEDCLSEDTHPPVTPRTTLQSSIPRASRGYVRKVKPQVKIVSPAQAAKNRSANAKRWATKIQNMRAFGSDPAEIAKMEARRRASLKQADYQMEISIESAKRLSEHHPTVSEDLEPMIEPTRFEHNHLQQPLRFRDFLVEENPGVLRQPRAREDENGPSFNPPVQAGSSSTKIKLTRIRPVDNVVKQPFAFHRDQLEGDLENAFGAPSKSQTFPATSETQVPSLSSTSIKPRKPYGVERSTSPEDLSARNVTESVETQDRQEIQYPKLPNSLQNVPQLSRAKQGSSPSYAPAAQSVSRLPSQAGKLSQTTSSHVTRREGKPMTIRPLDTAANRTDSNQFLKDYLKGPKISTASQSSHATDPEVSKSRTINGGSDRSVKVDPTEDLGRSVNPKTVSRSSLISQAPVAMERQVCSPVPSPATSNECMSPEPLGSPGYPDQVPQNSSAYLQNNSNSATATPRTSPTYPQLYSPTGQLVPGTVPRTSSNESNQASTSQQSQSISPGFVQPNPYQFPFPGQHLPGYPNYFGYPGPAYPMWNQPQMPPMYHPGQPQMPPTNVPPVQNQNMWPGPFAPMGQAPPGCRLAYIQDDGNQNAQGQSKPQIYYLPPGYTVFPQSGPPNYPAFPQTSMGYPYPPNMYGHAAHAALRQQMPQILNQVPIQAPVQTREMNGDPAQTKLMYQRVAQAPAQQPCEPRQFSFKTDDRLSESRSRIGANPASVQSGHSYQIQAAQGHQMSQRVSRSPVASNKPTAQSRHLHTSQTDKRRPVQVQLPPVNQVPVSRTKQEAHNVLNPTVEVRPVSGTSSALQSALGSQPIRNSSVQIRTLESAEIHTTMKTNVSERQRECELARNSAEAFSEEAAKNCSNEETFSTFFCSSDSKDRFREHVSDVEIMPSPFFEQVPEEPHIPWSDQDDQDVIEEETIVTGIPAESAVIQTTRQAESKKAEQQPDVPEARHAKNKKVKRMDTASLSSTFSGQKPVIQDVSLPTVQYQPVPLPVPISSQVIRDSPVVKNARKNDEVPPKPLITVSSMSLDLSRKKPVSIDTLESRDFVPMSKQAPVSFENSTSKEATTSQVIHARRVSQVQVPMAQPPPPRVATKSIRGKRAHFSPERTAVNPKKRWASIHQNASAEDFERFPAKTSIPKPAVSTNPPRLRRNIDLLAEKLAKRTALSDNKGTDSVSSGIHNPLHAMKTTLMDPHELQSNAVHTESVCQKDRLSTAVVSLKPNKIAPNLVPTMVESPVPFSESRKSVDNLHEKFKTLVNRHGRLIGKRGIVVSGKNRICSRNPQTVSDRKRDHIRKDELVDQCQQQVKLPMMGRVVEEKGYTVKENNQKPQISREPEMEQIVKGNKKMLAQNLVQHPLDRRHPKEIPATIKPELYEKLHPRLQSTKPATFLTNVVSPTSTGNALDSPTKNSNQIPARIKPELCQKRPPGLQTGTILSQTKTNHLNEKEKRGRHMQNKDPTAIEREVNAMVEGIFRDCKKKTEKTAKLLEPTLLKVPIQSAQKSASIVTQVDAVPSKIAPKLGRDNTEGKKMIVLPGNVKMSSKKLNQMISTSSQKRVEYRAMLDGTNDQRGGSMKAPVSGQEVLIKTDSKDGKAKKSGQEETSQKKKVLTMEKKSQKNELTPKHLTKKVKTSHPEKKNTDRVLASTTLQKIQLNGEALAKIRRDSLALVSSFSLWNTTSANTIWVLNGLPKIYKTSFVKSRLLELAQMHYTFNPNAKVIQTSDPALKLAMSTLSTLKRARPLAIEGPPVLGKNLAIKADPCLRKLLTVKRPEVLPNPKKNLPPPPQIRPEVDDETKKMITKLLETKNPAVLTKKQEKALAELKAWKPTYRRDLKDWWFLSPLVEPHPADIVPDLDLKHIVTLHADGQRHYIHMDNLVKEITLRQNIYGVNQTIFAQTVVETSQCNFSLLLRRVKKFEELKSARLQYENMLRWLQLPEKKRLQRLGLVPLDVEVQPEPIEETKPIENPEKISGKKKSFLSIVTKKLSNLLGGKLKYFKNKDNAKKLLVEEVENQIEMFAQTKYPKKK